MTDIYRQLLMMSTVTAILFLALKLISKLTHKYFSASWHYVVHISLYTFFLFPYYKIMDSWDWDFINKGKGNLEFLSVTESTDDHAASSIVDSSHTSVTLIDFLPYVLLAGAVVFLSITFIQYYQMRRHISHMPHTNNTQIMDELTKTREQLDIKKHIYIVVAPYKTTPFLFGIWKPRLVLPNVNFTNEEYHQIFLHEISHYKRHDAWFKLLVTVINAINWFNPIAYMARRDIDRYCELSCDEKIVQFMNVHERRQYSELLLNVLWQVTHRKKACILPLVIKEKILKAGFV